MSLLSPTPQLFHHVSRKRTREDTPRSIKRNRPMRAALRPDWVIDRDHATRVDARIDSTTRVDVLYPAGGLEVGVGVGSLLRGGSGFTVLCFGEATEECIGDVVVLLESLGAGAFGISLDTVGGEEIVAKMPILFDRQKILTSRLGLLHPLGGGRQALDAIVVLDGGSRARMVLPIGWGVRGGGDEAGNRWGNVVGRLVRGLEWLRGEGEGEEGCEEVEMVMA